MRQNDKAGALNPYTRQMILTKDSTEMVAFHQLAHVREFEELGEASYKTLSHWKKK